MCAQLAHPFVVRRAKPHPCLRKPLGNGGPSVGRKTRRVEHTISRRLVAELTLANALGHLLHRHAQPDVGCARAIPLAVNIHRPFGQIALTAVGNREPEETERPRGAPVSRDATQPVVRNAHWPCDVMCAELREIRADNRVPVALKPCTHQLGAADTFEAIHIAWVAAQQYSVIGYSTRNKYTLQPCVVVFDWHIPMRSRINEPCLYPTVSRSTWIAA